MIKTIILALFLVSPVMAQESIRIYSAPGQGRYVLKTGDTMTGQLNGTSAVFSGTETIQGNAFSVGGSTFVVNQGIVKVGGLLSQESYPNSNFIVAHSSVVITSPENGVSNPPAYNLLTLMASRPDNYRGGYSSIDFSAQDRGNSVYFGPLTRIYGGQKENSCRTCTGADQLAGMFAISVASANVPGATTFNTPIERLRITGDGLVGIGQTPDTNAALSVAGNISNTGVITSSGATPSYFAGSMTLGSGATNQMVLGANRVLTIYGGASGNQQGALEIAGRGGTDGFTIGKIDFVNTNSAGSNNARIASYQVGGNGGGLDLYTNPGGNPNPSVRMRIDTAGNVGIGNTNPITLITASSGTLTIDGNVQNAIDLSVGSTIHTFKPGVGTKAQLKALAPAAIGLVVYCSDCTTATLLVSTGTSAGNWCMESNRTTSLGSW